MNFSQRAAQRFNFPFVSEFLAFGQFDKFKHFLHLVERLFEQFHNLCHFFNRPADGRRDDRIFRRRKNRRGGRRTGLGNLFRSTSAASAPAAMATPSSTADIVRRRGAIRFSWCFVRHFCASMTHRRTKAMANCDYFFTNSASEAV